MRSAVSRCVQRSLCVRTTSAYEVHEHKCTLIGCCALQIRGPSQYANGGWGDPRDQQLCRHFAGMADLPPGVTRMQPSERQQGEAQLAENDVKTTDMHAAAVRLPAKKKAAKHRNLPFSEQMAPNPGILSSLMVS